MQLTTFLTEDTQRQLTRIVRVGTESIDSLHKFLREAEYNISIHFMGDPSYEIVDVSVRPMDQTI